jgi:hypothetical protein
MRPTTVELHGGRQAGISMRRPRAELSRRLARSAATVVVALITAACTQFTPYRTMTLARGATASDVALLEIDCSVRGDDRSSHDLSVGPGGPPPRCESMDEPAGRDTRPEAGRVSVERAEPGAHAVQHRHYVYRKGPEATRGQQPGDYHLTFVEFDDQGWFADRKQMEALFMLLGRFERAGKHPLILVYAHGWKHDASPCDGNVLCFSRLLERMDVLERERGERDTEPSPRCDREAKRAPRPVVGVYVGWRGLSLEGPLTNLSFWTRKATAERVGRGGVKELLTRLNNYRGLRNPDRCDDRTQLVVAGHSFGGLVVYSALSHVLMDRAGEIGRFDTPSCREIPRDESAHGRLCYDVARSFGDFVVLVNPAFEGSLYEPLFHLATNRCYPDRQRPIMMTVTSSADDATGKAFPAGRALSTVFEHRRDPAQRESILDTVGHDTRYETHTLQWVGAAAERAGRETVSRGACDCTQLAPTAEFRWWEFAGGLESRLKRAASPSTRAAGGPVPILADMTAGKRVYPVYSDEVRLVGDPKYTPNYPYLVVTAAPEIIPDHNSIYTEPFIRFLHAFFLLHIASRHTFEGASCFDDVPACTPGGPLPCEQSCRLPDGGSCSGRRTDDIPDARR